jgi:predicted ABC-type ATPase
VYDNSRVLGPVKVAELVEGVPIGAASWPPWAPEPIVSRWSE